jgi:small subunit ribosomal protein S20
VAHSLSAKKRIRQNLKRRAQNRARKQRVRLSVRELREAMQKGDRDKAQAVLQQTVKTIDRVAAKGTFHKNTASRKKAHLQKRFNAAFAGG